MLEIATDAKKIVQCKHGSGLKPLFYSIRKILRLSVVCVKWISELEKRGVHARRPKWHKPPFLYRIRFLLDDIKLELVIIRNTRNFYPALIQFYYSLTIFVLFFKSFFLYTQTAYNILPYAALYTWAALYTTVPLTLPTAHPPKIYPIR